MKFSNINLSKVYSFEGFKLSKIDQTKTYEQRDQFYKDNLLSNFKEKHPAYDIPNYATFEKVMQLSPDIQKWYKKFNTSYAIVQDMPEAFLDSNISQEEWLKLEAARREINAINTKLSRDQEAQAKEHDKKMKDLVDKAKLEISKYSGLVRVINVSVQDLSVNDHIEIANAESHAKKQDLINKKVTIYMMKCIKDFKDNKNFEQTLDKPKKEDSPK